MHKSAVATVKLLDLGMEAAYDIRRQGTLMVAKYAVGHGSLRPEALSRSFRVSRRSNPIHNGIVHQWVGP
jgi:hypothetical protein